MNLVKTKQNLNLPSTVFLQPDLPVKDFPTHHRKKKVTAHGQTRALKTNSLDLLATVCAQKRYLETSSYDPVREKKPRTFIDSRTKSTKKSHNSFDCESENSVEPQTMPTYSFHALPLLGYHMPHCFKQRIWQNIRTQRLGFEVVRLVFGSKIKEHSRKRVSFDEMILEILVASTFH